MALSKRLSAIASMVEKGMRIADIGSDHCALPIFLFEKGVIDYAMAIENKKGPYAHMVDEIRKSGFPIAPSFSDGLSDLSEEVNAVILAGMGGGLIASILKKGASKLSNVETIITDAHTEREKVLSWMEGNNFEAADGLFLLEKGIPYEIVKWKKADAPVHFTDEERLFGPIPIRKGGSDWQTYLMRELGEKERILALLPDESEKRGTLTTEIEAIRKELRR